MTLEKGAEESAPFLFIIVRHDTANLYSFELTEVKLIAQNIGMPKTGASLLSEFDFFDMP